MNKFLSDLYDLEETGLAEDDRLSDILERIGYLDFLREHIGGMGLKELHYIVYDNMLDELINDKEKFVDAVDNHLGIEDSTEDCIEMALAVGLIKSREEAMQKYGDSLKELFGLEQ